MTFLDELSPQTETFRRVVLDLVKVQTSHRISRAVADSARLELARDPLTRGLVADLTAYVLADHLPPVSVRETADVDMVRPATWWDHAKLTYAPRWWAGWWVRRHPARIVTVPHRLTVVVDLHRFRTYPQADVDLSPELGASRYGYFLDRTIGRAT